MYLTAQRVRSATDEGVNVFEYVSGSARMPLLPDGRLDVVAVAEESPGQFVSSMTPIPPGGNVVVSYLDIACPDSIPLQQLEAITFPSAPGGYQPGMPHVWWAGAIGVRFGAQLSLVWETAQAEFNRLKAALLEVFKTPRTSAGPAVQAPLTIEVELSDDVWSFRLAEGSRRRLESMGATLPLAGAIRIETTTKSDFEALRGPLSRHVAGLLTNMAIDQLVATGGIQFVPAQDPKRVIWELTRPIYTSASTVPELAAWARSLLSLVSTTRAPELEPIVVAELEQFESRFRLIVDSIESLPQDRNPLSLGLEPRPGKAVRREQAEAFLTRALLAMEPPVSLADRVRRSVLEYLAARNLYEEFSAGPGWPQKFGATSPDTLIEVVWDLLMRGMIKVSDESKVVRPAAERCASRPPSQVPPEVVAALLHGNTELKITMRGQGYLCELQTSAS